MPTRRILSIWFPRLGAERLLRRVTDPDTRLFAVVSAEAQDQVLTSVSLRAEALGLKPGQPLRTAQALCPDLITRPRNRAAEAAFLAALGRWAGRFSPLVGIEGTAGLLLDVTGCAHLFGGEAGLIATLRAEAGDLGLSLRCGLADTVGGAWALARYAGQGVAAQRSGDAIDQEARATRSRAAKRRHWERGGAAPVVPVGAEADEIAPPGHLPDRLAPLPVAALRLPPVVVADLARLGLRRIGDLAAQPRASLARRFGPEVMLRLDQALGHVPEPMSPSAPAPRFATRLSLPDPIGLRGDLEAAVCRLTERLCLLLQGKGQGARHLRLEAYRADGGLQAVEVRLARAVDQPEAMRPLLEMQLDRIDAGFGIDMLRLETIVTARMETRQGESGLGRGRGPGAQEAALADLITRLGGRIGLEAITRRHPAESHIPEKSALTLAAAWSEPAPAPWPTPEARRPLLIWSPEAVTRPETGDITLPFRWRGRVHEVAGASGPERIAPEWWLEDPAWRSGVRDYWQVVTTRGERLWLFRAHGGQISGGWFCQGRFA
ncbi:putative DNA repair enzyme [Roseovarius sp. EC-HK134]|jgi:protein ImuB|uniref:Y-family DNA polymerase n=1 Tax=unclassified Roseovarius TaxID=2614913 RepID=UPI0001556F5E|nr:MULTISPECIES: DNA polymerase Y family protein [unclassified Roseovarius]AWZ19548.1 DNA polymerase IV [Roseovarius sp. AK1035]EDM33721.1 Putative DNA repair enzyme [Roseovarius sp. TM1035]VVT13214.1 putative DNA repair enzyme [Roseovarius sp. EC-HK134]VVT13385.1 putative DNA repair enzyme [Roseovarius sp. EC-SD190]